MAGYRQGRPSWTDPSFYPISENLVKGAKTEADAVFLVDVGGGKGHDLQDLSRKYPMLPGQLILQDLKDVIGKVEASADLDTNIVAMGHDFFTKQPVIGMVGITASDRLLTVARCTSLLYAFLSAQLARSQSP